MEAPSKADVNLPPQSSTDLTTHVDRSTVEITSKIDDLRSTISSKQQAIEVLDIETQQQVSATLASSAHSQALAKTRHEEIERQIDRGNTKVIDEISSKIKNVSKIVSTHLRLRKTTSGRKIRFSGSSRETMMIPLLLCNGQLQSAILHFVSTQ